MPIGALRASRVLFLLTVAYAGGMFWLAPHPPMVDLPHHAGQVALLHDLVLGQSPWRDLVQIHWFTPYLVGYGLSLFLSFLMPVTAAIKLLLTLAYYAFVYCCVRLRRRFDGDERLDWLFIPGFFGFAYVWGLFPFLVATPFGLLFILVSDRYAGHPDLGGGVRLSLAGLLLFFCHGLIFLFACGIAVGLIAVRNRQPMRLLAALLPFFPLALLSVVYARFSTANEAAIPFQEPDGISWDWNWVRLRFVVEIFGASWHDELFAAAGGLMLLAPMMMGSRLNLRTPTALVPMAAMALLWLSVPSYAMRTALLYERFALFILPFYALMFRRQELAAGEIEDGAVKARVGQMLLALLCWTFLGLQTDRLVGFAKETSDFDAVLAAVGPGHRALTLVFDTESEAAGSPWTYVHYPAWYQAEHRGFVDLNFAWYPAMIVRFRNNMYPMVRPGFEWKPESFNWVLQRGWKYRYFFVRRTRPLPPDFFVNNWCEVSRLKSVGTWSVYETVRCR